MHEIGNITDRLLPALLQTVSNVGALPKSDVSPVPSAARGQGEVDRADFSELGRSLSLAGERPDVRVEKVAEVRAAIERNADAFIAERLEGTARRLAEALRDIRPRR